MALLVLLYAALAVFLVVNVIRIVRIATMPVHVRWELSPVPQESPESARGGGSCFEKNGWWTESMRVNRTGGARAMVSEIFFLKGVWKHNRPLWLWSWLFHLGLYLLIGTTGLLFLGSFMDRLSNAMPGAAAADAARVVTTLTRISAWLAVSCGTVGTLGMIVIRAGSPKLRPFTSFGACFNLLLLLAIFSTGFLSLITNPAALGSMVALAGALLGLNAAPQVQGIAAAHICSVVLFLAYFPFSHMTHMYLKYFTCLSARRDDRPAAKMAGQAENTGSCMKYPANSSAPPIQGDGARTSGDITKKHQAG